MAGDIIDFKAERRRHKDFVGREDVLARLDDHLVGPGSACGWVLVTGQPGAGKSALLTRWLSLAEQAGHRVSYHFIRRGIANWHQPEAISRSLAAQIEVLYPAQAEPKASLLDLLGRVSDEVLEPEGTRLVLVVDGLDEATAAPGQNPLELFLPYTLPPGVMVLCGSRPTYEHLGWLEGRGALQRIDLDEAQWEGSNEAVCRALWAGWAPGFEPPLAAGFVQDALAAGAGNVLYALKLWERLQAQPAGERRVERLPQGLKGLLEQAWAALPPMARVGLGVVCAAREALPREPIEAAAGWESPDAWGDFLRAARPFLLEEKKSAEGMLDRYRPYHESFRELVGEKVGAKGMRGHHRKLLETVAAWPAAPEHEDWEEYALKHAVEHALAAVETKEKARELCKDVAFLEGWCREGGEQAIERGLKEAGEALKDDEVTLLHRVVRAESHWLQAEPEALGELVYNRLRSTGWEAERIRKGLRWGDRWPAYRLRHPVRMGWERTLAGHTQVVTGCAVTPDGRRIVSASHDKTLKVWDLESGKLLTTLKGHTGSVTGCAVTPDGRIVSASWDTTLKVWDLKSGKPPDTLVGHTGRVMGCAVTPDGRIVSASDDNTLKVWDLKSRKPPDTLVGHTGWVMGCAVTPDGRIVSASSDNTLKVWDLKSGKPPETLVGHTAVVTGCAVTPNGRRIISASEDNTLKVWDLKSGKPPETLVGHTAVVTGCAVMPDGRIVSASADNTLKVWDLESGKPPDILEGHTSEVTGCAVTPDGRIVSASNDTTLKVWDLKSGKPPETLKGHTGVVMGCAVTPDGRIVSASNDTTLKVWDLKSGKPSDTLKGHTGAVWGCAVTPDGRIVSASNDTTLKVWDLKSGKPPETLKGHTGVVRGCAVTPDGRIVSASDDKTLKVWDLKSGKPPDTLKGHTGAVWGCAVTPDDRIVSASNDKTLKVWDLKSGKPSDTLKGHTWAVWRCAVTPDGRIVSASWDTTLKVWDLKSGKPPDTLKGHTGLVRGCAVTPDGRRIVSASEDNTLKVWDLATRKCLATLHGLAPFMSVAATRDILCAGDSAGNLWFLETPWSTPTSSKPMPAAPLKLFYSYAHKDEPFREELETHLKILKRQGLIEPWHDRAIIPGSEWAGDIAEHLEKADVIVLLVSANFIASDYSFDIELKRAMERHEAGEARVIPILIKPCDWKGAPFGKLQALPKDAKPINTWSNQDEAWTDVAMKLRSTIEAIRAQRT